MAKLVIESGNNEGAVYPLEQAVTTIGRSVSNTIQIVDRRMSRNHAEIHLNGHDFVIHDLGSKNGSLLNGLPLKTPQKLRHHDHIQFGDTIIRVEIEPTTGSKAIDDTTGSRRKRSTDSSMGSHFRMVEEKQWGATQGARRAGYDDQSEHTQLAEASLLDLKEPTKRLQIIYQVTDAIRSVLDPSELLDKIISIIQAVIHPDRTYLLMVSEETGDLEPLVVKVREGENPSEIRLSSSIVNRCMKEGVSLLVSDAAEDDRFNNQQSVILNAIRTAMVAPLIFKGESIGVIYVDTQSRPVAFADEELEVLTSIANQAAVAITNARLQRQILEQHKHAKEMEIARNIQMNLLPQTYPDMPGYQISAMSLPAKHVGGDYYDFLEMDDDRLGLAVADVSGKGVPAAILTAITRSYLQSETQHADSTIGHTVARLNRMVARDVSNDMYVTMFFSVLDVGTGLLEYVNAGHSYPLLVHPSGEIDYLKTGGIFLGIDPSAPYQVDSVEIPPGGVLVLFTDGVTDIMNSAGKPFGAERFEELINDKRHLTAEEIRNAIYQACITHRGPAEQFDDFTLIVIKRLDFNESEID